MPSIRPSTDLRNSYNQISKYFHTHSEPVYITKNGKDDLIVLDIEAYEKLVGRFEISTLLDQGLEDVKQKNYKNADEIFDEFEGRYKDVKL
ncbi:type II toxin-antitoxin system Phd/YefM family antitoxin [Anaerocolumna aminovalerica]|uniref:Antitoxin n=1 Tax=Anaerocolumna aminovalerica TaxID=1527 RepID=A0A1I5C2U9_9FIRM|nr:type II toxin-antitoxin system Phd/YefM family antitoxin [Anaerocolumna aminovalerica]SFN81353.1 Antitoxin Phd_YefM, type II toxin-antitoxin system [Anaerocolumna aminovalerica]